MNKIISLEILKDVKDYFDTYLNEAIKAYNNVNNTKLLEMNNITYNSIKMLLPEIYIGIERTNFENEDFQSDYTKKVINNCYVSLAYRNNNADFQDDIERYVYILVNLLEKIETENIAILNVKTVNRGELQDKNMQTIKIINIDFDTISYT